MAKRSAWLLTLLLPVELARATPAFLDAPQLTSRNAGGQDWSAVAVGPDGIVYLIDQERNGGSFTDIRCHRFAPPVSGSSWAPTSGAAVSPRGVGIDEQDQPYAAFVRGGFVYVAGSTYAGHYGKGPVPNNSTADWYVMRFNRGDCSRDSSWPSGSPGAIVLGDSHAGRPACPSTFGGCYDEPNGLYVDSAEQYVYVSGYLNANNPNGTNNPNESSIGLAKFRVSNGSLVWAKAWHPSAAALGKLDSTDGNLVVDEASAKIYLTGRIGDCAYGAIGDIHCLAGNELSRGFVAQFADGASAPGDPVLGSTYETWDRVAKAGIFDRAYDQGLGLVSDGTHLYVVGARRFRNASSGVTNDNVELYVRRFSLAAFGSQSETVARYQETEPATFFSRSIGVDPTTHTIYVAMNRGTETGAPGRIELLVFKPGAIAGSTTPGGDDGASPPPPNLSTSGAEIEKGVYGAPGKPVAARNLAVAYPNVYVAASLDTGAPPAGTDPVLVAFGPTTFGDDFAGAAGLPRAWTGLVDGANGELSLSPFAGLDGDGRGLLATIAAGSPSAAYSYLRSTDAASRTRWKARLWLGTRGLTMADGDRFTVLRGLGRTGGSAGQTVIELAIERVVVNGSPKIRASLTVDGSDGASAPRSVGHVILDPLDGGVPDPRHLEIEWRSASTTDANDGAASISDLGAGTVSRLDDLDNHTSTLTEAQLGVVGGVDAGTSGTVELDRYDSLAP